jgi:hypothetical protein
VQGFASVLIAISIVRIIDRTEDIALAEDEHDPVDDRR